VRHGPRDDGRGKGSQLHVSETVEIRGHLIDSGILTRILDDIRDYEGDYVIDRFDVGKGHDDESYARVSITAESWEGLQRLVMRLQGHGVNLVNPGQAVLRTVERDGVFPDDFYSTTNLETVVRLGSAWVPVENPEMDCGLVVTGGDAGPGDQYRIRTVPVSDVKAGSRVVCGATGVRVVPMLEHSPSPGERGFEFMKSDVSSEKPQALLVRQIAEQIRDVKADGRRVLWVCGPAVVHTGAAPAMVALIEAGFVDVLFAGNALATHDIESALYGTSLGVDLSQGAASSTGTSTTSGPSTGYARKDR
jgi:lysine-ketoglutarate reductase/saccharopine dehydrogenase-like protein (TIGR00300 family)